MAGAEVQLAGIGSANRTVNERIAASYTIRENLALTTSYVAGGANTNYFKALGYDRITLLFKLTWVDSTSVQWIVEWSDDAVTWYQSTNELNAAGVTAVRSGTVTNAASANWCESVPVEGVYCRVSSKKTGGTGGDSLQIIALGITL